MIFVHSGCPLESQTLESSLEMLFLGPARLYPRTLWEQYRPYSGSSMELWLCNVIFGSCRVVLARVAARAHEFSCPTSVTWLKHFSIYRVGHKHHSQPNENYSLFWHVYKARSLYDLHPSICSPVSLNPTPIAHATTCILEHQPCTVHRPNLHHEKGPIAPTSTHALGGEKPVMTR